MKITVGNQVIGGFVVISALLITLGISSIVGVSNLGSASEELSDVALPTVAGSADLKASFLNMGRLTFEGFVAEHRDLTVEKQNAYNTTSAEFKTVLGNLRETASSDEELSRLVAKVESLFNEYNEASIGMFSSHLSAVDKEKTLASMVSTLEDNIDDASTLLLDFTDLDEISEFSTLKAAADEAESLESDYLQMLSAATEYSKTKTLKRAELRKQEVELLLSENEKRTAHILATAKGDDPSGSLEDVSSLMGEISKLVGGREGLLNIKLAQIDAKNTAQVLLDQSDSTIKKAEVVLDELNAVAKTKAATVKQSVADQISSSTMIVVLVIIGSLILASAIAYFSVRAITVPLAKVNELLQIASSGDLTHRLDDSSEDEFGELSKNCNTLIDSLKELIACINERADRLAAASAQSSTVMLQTTSAIEDQKMQVSQVAAATNELHTTSELVTNNADDTMKQIKHADVEAEKVKVISAQNKSTIQVLAKDVEEAASVINKLHQDSASIGGILDVIRGVADQTNLLALNAAIEAARAGEQGRGFAVVADEVRTLASRTQESTQEINAMIEVLQAGAEKAVSVMNQGKEQTIACVEQTEVAGDALNLITEAVHNAYEVSTRIEQAAREQHTVSSEISERLENIVSIAEQTTVGAQQTSESSADVANLAGELQTSIGRFKV